MEKKWMTLVFLLSVHIRDSTIGIHFFSFKGSHYDLMGHYLVSVTIQTMGTTHSHLEQCMWQKMTLIAAYASVMTDKLATVCMLSKEASLFSCDTTAKCPLFAFLFYVINHRTNTCQPEQIRKIC